MRTSKASISENVSQLNNPVGHHSISHAISEPSAIDDIFDDSLARKSKGRDKVVAGELSPAMKSPSALGH